MTHAERQARYTAKRAEVTGRQVQPLRDFRIYTPDGRDRIERHAHILEVARLYPGATRIERVDVWGGFY